MTVTQKTLTQKDIDPEGRSPKKNFTQIVLSPKKAFDPSSRSSAMPQFKRSFSAFKSTKSNFLQDRNVNTDLLLLQVSMFSKYSLCNDVVWSTKKLNYLVNLQIKRFLGEPELAN